MSQKPITRLQSYVKSAEPAIDGLKLSPFKHIKKRATKVTLFLNVDGGT